MTFLLAQRLCLIQFFQNWLECVALLQLLQRPCQGLFQQACALSGEDRFRMELETANAIGIVPDRHHHSVKVGVDG